MTTTIVVTGATGTIGSQVIAGLAARTGLAVRAALRKGEGRALPAGVAEVEFDYARPETYATAVRGADKLFLLTPFSDQQVQYGTALIDAAKAEGVKHIVKLSAYGADHEPGIQLGRWHRAVEKHLEASGVAHTILRPNNFMQNFVGYYPPDATGAIYLPIGASAVSYIDARDVGAVAAEVLAASGTRHHGRAYTPTGPTAVTIAQVAAALSEVSGRKITYVDVPESAARDGKLGAGLPAWMVDAMLELHAIAKAGYASTVTRDVEDVTGKGARSFAAFAQEHAAAWRK